MSKWIWINAGRFRWQVSTEFAGLPWLASLNAPERLIAAPAERLTREQPGKNSSVHRTAPLHEPGATVIVKRYRPNHRWDIIRSVARQSPARRAFERAFALQQLEIPTARPIAAGERRALGFLRESFLILEDVSNARTWRQLLAEDAASLLRRACLTQLAGMLARLHDAGLAHTDITLGNFLVRGGGRSRQLMAIDLDGIRPARRQSLRAIVKDLRTAWRRLPMTPRERLWFCASYSKARSRSISSRDLLTLLASAPKN